MNNITCNFIDFENKCNWNNNIKCVGYDAMRSCSKRTEVEKNNLDKIFSYFERLLTVYPGVLTDKQIKEDVERLISYSKEKGIPIQQCYTYSHSEDVGPNSDKVSVGLRITNLKYFNGAKATDNVVNMVFYNYNSNGVVLGKQELRFVLKDNEVDWRYLLRHDEETSRLIEDDMLEYLKPKTYIK